MFDALATHQHRLNDYHALLRQPSTKTKKQPPENRRTANHLPIEDNDDEDHDELLMRESDDTESDSGDEVLYWKNERIIYLF